MTGLGSEEGRNRLLGSIVDIHTACYDSNRD